MSGSSREGADTPSSISQLNERIVNCTLCPRLVEHREAAARARPKRFAGEDYWARPLTGFGDFNARLLIIGLAPAAHGGNRTGRMFTGDSSGNTLMRALYAAGFANKPVSERLGDGLELQDAYMTAVVRCPPPGNMPAKQEVENCLPYLLEEIRLLRRVEVVVTLGGLAFNTFLRILKRHATMSSRAKPVFRHNSLYRFEGEIFGRRVPLLVSSYHPSRQNTQTGRLTQAMLNRVFVRVRRLLDGL